MLRKLAAVISAALVAAGLVAAPEEPDTAPLESAGDPVADASFLFGPLADVPHLLPGDRAVPPSGS